MDILGRGMTGFTPIRQLGQLEILHEIVRCGRQGFCSTQHIDVASSWLQLVPYRSVLQKSCEYNFIEIFNVCISKVWLSFSSEFFIKILESAKNLAILPVLPKPNLLVHVSWQIFFVQGHTKMFWKKNCRGLAQRMDIWPKLFGSFFLHAFP